MSIQRIGQALECAAMWIMFLSLAPWSVFFYGFIAGDDGVAIPWAVVTFASWMVMSGLMFISLIIQDGEWEPFGDRPA